MYSRDDTRHRRINHPRRTKDEGTNDWVGLGWVGLVCQLEKRKRTLMILDGKKPRARLIRRRVKDVVVPHRSAIATSSSRLARRSRRPPASMGKAWLEGFKFSVYLAVPVALTAAFAVNPENLEAVIRNVRHVSARWRRRRRTGATTKRRANGSDWLGLIKSVG